jgi:Ankyrin repeats (3 copies)
MCPQMGSPHSHTNRNGSDSINFALLLNLACCIFQLFISSQNGKTLLHLAAYRGNLQLVKVLVKKGIDIHAIDNVSQIAHCVMLPHSQHLVDCPAQSGLASPRHFESDHE